MREGETPKTAVTRFAKGTQQLAVQDDPEHQRLIEDDVAEIVHDLKGPLSTIALDAMLLEDTLMRGEATSGLRSIARINQNVAFLDRLVLDLLDVCSIASGEFKLRREPVELRGLLERAINRVVATQDRARVVLDANETVTLLLDQHRIERVVANLLDNALNHTPASSNVVVRMTTRNGHACISTIDGGPGIAEAELTCLFDRYQRGESTRSRGFGLGLYICRKIVEAHGGVIGVESARGTGSRFFFELPPNEPR